MRGPAKGDFAEKTIRRPANDSRRCRRHYVTCNVSLDGICTFKGSQSRPGKNLFLRRLRAVCGVASAGLAAFCKRLVSGTPAGIRLDLDRAVLQRGNAVFTELSGRLDRA